MCGDLRAPSDAGAMFARVVGGTNVWRLRVPSFACMCSSGIKWPNACSSVWPSVPVLAFHGSPLLRRGTTSVHLGVLV